QYAPTMSLFYTLSTPKCTGIGFTKWTSSLTRSHTSGTFLPTRCQSHWWRKVSMCCLRFTMSPSSRKEGERQLKQASDMAEVEYRAIVSYSEIAICARCRIQTRIFEELVPSLITENEFERDQGIR